MSNSLDRAGISTKLMDLQKSPRHSLCTNVQELSWSFPAQLIPHAWLRASGHVRGFWCIQNLSHSGWVSSVSMCCLHAIWFFFFQGNLQEKYRGPSYTCLFITIAFKLPRIALAFYWMGMKLCRVLQCSWSYSSLSDDELKLCIFIPWVSLGSDSQACYLVYQIATCLSKRLVHSRWEKDTDPSSVCVQPHGASTSTRGSGGAHLVLLEPSGNTSLCICFSKSWMHPALRDTDRETERFWAGEVEAAWKQNWDWFVSMWVNMGFPYPFCDQEKVGNYCNLNLKKLSKIQSEH